MHMGAGGEKICFPSKEQGREKLRNADNIPELLLGALSYKIIHYFLIHQDSYKFKNQINLF